MQYGERDLESLGNTFHKHLTAMTLENLHSKAAIAAELAYRDLLIDAYRDLLIDNLLDKQIEKDEAITENTSDGFHTFKELYDFRKLYNAALFNQLAKQGKCDVHKSQYHNDGEKCFGGGWFIVVAILPEGQISNHYEMADWDLFQIPEVPETLHPFDGYTSEDVMKRLISFCLYEGE